ncbi:MAG: magnesium/cobalt transporter CorA [bacterium]|nr:magnesium/cobalt transporter CorA [bacterium]
MIKSFYYIPGEPIQITEGIADFDKMAIREDAVLWIDMCRPTDEESFILTHDFHFHPLAIEDVLSERPRTKIDDYDRYLFVVLQIVDYIGREEGLKIGEIDFFLSGNSLVTVHYDDHRIFDFLYNRAERDERLMTRGADFLLHAIIDALVDNYNATLDIFEYDVDQVEEDVLGEPDEELVRTIYTLRRDIVHLRRIVLPQRELVQRLSKEKFKLVSGKAAVYFADVHDHLVRVDDLANFHRDILNSSLETYYSTVSTKTNEIIKFLTIFTVLFIPPTFMVGLWGMNFAVMPELNWEHGYLFALLAMLVVVLILVLFFRKKKWL